MVHKIFLVASYLSLIPCAFLLTGALRKVWLHPHRLSRLQLEGIIILLIGLFLRIAFFDPLLGRDPHKASIIAYWLDRGEHGLFAIGLILFGLGYFLERRPHPGLESWPVSWRRSARIVFAIGIFCSLACLFIQPTAGPLPWSPIRSCFLLGSMVFAKVYCYFAFVRPQDAARVARDIISMEEL